MKLFPILSLFLFILYVSCRMDEHTDDMQFSRTIIVYMAADNDLSDDAWDNIKEWTADEYRCYYNRLTD